ncbi:MAG: hypothetical protein WCZ90_19115 [Melioribacteraceae bacterium]
MKKSISVCFFSVALFVTSCSLFQKDSFQGDWQLTLTGALSETIQFTIKDDNSFYVRKNIQYGSREYDAEINGKIEKDGKVTAEIIASGQPMGQLDGYLNFETGKGKWNASIISGEWTATKK